MENLRREHFIQAAHYISHNPIPSKRGLRTWAVPINGINYPPKLALSVALHLSGDNQEISSGKEFITNEALLVLVRFGFQPVKL